VLAVRDRCSDEISRVGDAGRLGKVDHVVGVVLLVANAARREEGVDAVNAGQVDAWLVREDVTAADELWGYVCKRWFLEREGCVCTYTDILPLLRDIRKVSLRDAALRSVMDNRAP